MTDYQVLELYNWFEKNGISVWICGGWCVDALLDRQTRDHKDLDIAVQRKDNARLRRLLEDNGYKEEKRSDSSEFMYVMTNEAGQIVDVHAFDYNENGRNSYGVEFPFGSLTGKGTISGQEVNCINPEWMYKFNTSYEPKDNDVKDIRALCEQFGFVLPEGY
jgi:lincosamide nucleotidyltransferase A/C/D/E